MFGGFDKYGHYLDPQNQLILNLYKQKDYLQVIYYGKLVGRC
jgi:hypothetical protein